MIAGMTNVVLTAGAEGRKPNMRDYKDAGLERAVHKLFNGNVDDATNAAVLSRRKDFSLECAQNLTGQ